MLKKTSYYLDVLLYLAMVILSVFSLVKSLLNPTSSNSATIFYILSTASLVLATVLSVARIKLNRKLGLVLNTLSIILMAASACFLLIANGYITKIIGQVIIAVFLVLTVVIAFMNYYLVKNS